MAPLNPNSTLRYYLDYATGLTEHTAVMRAIAPQSPADVGTQVGNVLTALAPLMCQISILRLRFSAVGSDISTPVTSGIEGATFGAGVPNTQEMATSLNFVGRSSGGRRCRFSVFGYQGASSDFRLTDTESPEVTAALANINGAANNWRSIDGLKPLWYAYADVSINAYWQRKLRG